MDALAPEGNVFGFGAAELETLAAALRAHPGVRQAMVVEERSDSENRRLVGYVIPDDDYLDEMSCSPQEASLRLAKWRTVFDLSQKGKEARFAEPGFNVASWNSSYTRKPFASEQMRDWVEMTVSEILSLNPREVLELGCGSGLLLLPIAPRCRRYVGLDLSAESLKSLSRQMQQLGESWTGVSLLECSADSLDSLGDHSFDTAIINSVIQYFPHVEYLTKVLRGAIEKLTAGGSLFIGDVRSLPLLPAFASSVELYHAPATLPVDELRQRIRKRASTQEELLISPEFFLGLPNHCPRISRVEIHPKRGCFANEMTQFRYNAILHLSPAHEEPLTPSWIDWDECKLTIAQIRKILKDKQPEILAFKGVGNARIEKDITAVEIMSGNRAPETAGQLRDILQGSPTYGVDPEDLWQLAEQEGYHVGTSWASCRRDGRYEAVFQRRGDDGKPLAAVKWPQADVIASGPSQYVNKPGMSTYRRKLVSLLSDDVREKCRWSNGLEIVLVEALPSKDESDGQC